MKHLYLLVFVFSLTLLPLVLGQKYITKNITFAQPADSKHKYEVREFDLDPCSIADKSCTNLEEMVIPSASPREPLLYGSECYFGQIDVPEGVNVTLYKKKGNFERHTCANGQDPKTISGPTNGLVDVWSDKKDERYCIFQITRQPGYSCKPAAAPVIHFSQPPELKGKYLVRDYKISPCCYPTGTCFSVREMPSYNSKPEFPLLDGSSCYFSRIDVPADTQVTMYREKKYHGRSCRDAYDPLVVKGPTDGSVDYWDPKDRFCDFHLSYNKTTVCPSKGLGRWPRDFNVSYPIDIKVSKFGGFVVFKASGILATVRHPDCLNRYEEGYPGWVPDYTTPIVQRSGTKIVVNAALDVDIRDYDVSVGWLLKDCAGKRDGFVASLSGQAVVALLPKTKIESCDFKIWGLDNVIDGVCDIVNVDKIVVNVIQDALNEVKELLCKSMIDSILEDL